jgi:hypothetical protein
VKNAAYALSCTVVELVGLVGQTAGECIAVRWPIAPEFTRVARALQGPLPEARGSDRSPRSHNPRHT